ncbi:hypothetical protein SRB5_42320 [Streptomyces sp. RB5]|uniref:Integral membrane protein n=1 Tax=Streptomyces smaragdinus TaxID=2585196 RepID=A0A7K0CKY6_9ACTN|nr:hypothetical protein [Streptomyces smaragdinus]MQY14071.1 hypothetical protein [Streptomyces smaragdinus]
MFDALTIAVAVAALGLAAWCAYAAFRDQPTKDWHLIGMALVGVAALVQLVVGIVRLAQGDDPHDSATVFVSYLVGAAFTLPAAAFLSLTERSRWGSATAAAGGVVLAVLQVRLYDIWNGTSG